MEDIIRLGEHERSELKASFRWDTKRRQINKDLEKTIMKTVTKAVGHIEKDGKKFKEYFGSSSNKAMSELYGKKDGHRASEGRYTLVPYKGEIKFFLQDLFGALRSTATYIGARQLKEFPRRATFIKTNRQLTTYLEQYDTGE